MLLCALPGYTPAGRAPDHAILPVSAFESFRSLFWSSIINARTVKPVKRRRRQMGRQWLSSPAAREPRTARSLLLTVATSRKVRPDGIHFQGLRYLDLTLAAYVGESVIIRYDPRDMAKSASFIIGAFCAEAICAELAGETISLRDIMRTRNRRRRICATRCTRAPAPLKPCWKLIEAIAILTYLR